MAVTFADLLDCVSFRLVNIIQLGNVDLSASHVMDELGLSVSVSLLNLSINLRVGICVDGIDGLSFDILIFVEKLIKASCNTIEETIEAMIDTSILILLDVNTAFGDSISRTGLLLGKELSDHLVMTINFVHLGHSLDLRDFRGAGARDTSLGDLSLFDSEVTDNQWLDK